ncbi:MAG TPA: DedA family protein [Rubrobacteraceae bacterium]|nr:DedA family protein [Rubrobacteraceae bacterium]
MKAGLTARPAWYKALCMELLTQLIQSIPSSPQGLLRFVTGLFLDHGYLVVFIGAAVDNFGLPASGDVVLFAGGWLANTERAALTAIMFFGALGALASDNAMYWIGRIGGRPLVERLFRFRLLARLLDAKHIGRVERYFDFHGGKTVFIGRFGPGLRSTTPLFAGLSRMKYYSFLPYNLAAIIIWAVAYASVGYFFGQYWGRLLEVARSVGFSVVAVVVLALLSYIYYRRRRRKP